MVRISTALLIIIITLSANAGEIHLNCGKYSINLDTRNNSFVEINQNKASLIREFINESKSSDYKINNTEYFFTLTESYSGEYMLRLQSPDNESRKVIACIKSD